MLELRACVWLANMNTVAKYYSYLIYLHQACRGTGSAIKHDHSDSVIA